MPIISCSRRCVLFRQKGSTSASTASIHSKYSNLVDRHWLDEARFSYQIQLDWLVPGCPGENWEHFFFQYSVGNARYGFSSFNSIPSISTVCFLFPRTLWTGTSVASFVILLPLSSNLPLVLMSRTRSLDHRYSMTYMVQKISLSW